jgi:hypothetical protein
MLTRRNTKPLHRSRLAKTFQPTVPSISWTAAIVGGKVRVTTTQNLTLNGVPHFTVQGVNPTAITSVSAGVFDLTYAATPVSTNVFVVDGSDPAVRNAVGGYLAAGSFTFP